MNASRKILIGLAPIDYGGFRAYYHKITLPPELTVREAAKQLSVSTFGCTPYVFASYPTDTSIHSAEKKLKALWCVYQAKAGEAVR